jgi:enediyne biosynthesis protein E4
MVDFDSDGDVDIYLVNDDILGNNQPNKLWRNDGPDGSGGIILTEIGQTNGSGVSVNGMGLGMGDPDNDGDFDLAYSDASPGHMLQNNNNGTFTDVSSSSGISAATSGDVGWGTVFFDYNNDGWEDLFFATGPISATAPVANSLLKNEGNAMFTNVSIETNMDNTEKGRGTAIGDVDGDGWVDLFLANYKTAPALMHNVSAANGNANHNLTFTVQGTDSNRDGIGTIIKVTTADGTQMRLISSGSNHGGGSQNAAFFGLGSATSATVEVIWPNGVTEVLGSFTADAAYHLVEPAAG